MNKILISLFHLHKLLLTGKWLHTGLAFHTGLFVWNLTYPSTQRFWVRSVRLYKAYIVSDNYLVILSCVPVKSVWRLTIWHVVWRMFADKHKFQSIELWGRKYITGHHSLSHTHTSCSVYIHFCLSSRRLAEIVKVAINVHSFTQIKELLRSNSDFNISVNATNGSNRLKFVCDDSGIIYLLILHFNVLCVKHLFMLAELDASFEFSGMLLLTFI